MLLCDCCLGQVLDAQLAKAAMTAAVEGAAPALPVAVAKFDLAEWHWRQEQPSPALSLDADVVAALRTLLHDDDEQLAACVGRLARGCSRHGRWAHARHLFQVRPSSPPPIPLSHPIPSHPIPSHPVPSHPIQSHPFIPSIYTPSIYEYSYYPFYI